MLIRVLEIPKSSEAFCFGGGHPQTWIEFDWFRDDPSLAIPDQPTMATAEGRVMIADFIKKKAYFREDKAYLVLHQDHTFTINYEAE